MHPITTIGKSIASIIFIGVGLAISGSKPGQIECSAPASHPIVTSLSLAGQFQANLRDFTESPCANSGGGVREISYGREGEIVARDWREHFSGGILSVFP